MELITKNPSTKLLDDSHIDRKGRSFYLIRLVAIFTVKKNYKIFTSKDTITFMKQKTWSYFNDFDKKQSKRPDLHLISSNIYDNRIEIEFEISPLIMPFRIINSLKNVLARKFLSEFEKYREMLDGHLWNSTYGLFSKEICFEEQRDKYLLYIETHKV